MKPSPLTILPHETLHLGIHVTHTMAKHWYFLSVTGSLTFLLVRSRRPSFTEGMCVCAVWMNPVAADCNWNRREIRVGQRGSEKTPSHTAYTLGPAFLSLYPYSSKAGNRTGLPGCAWVLTYHHCRASSDSSVTQTQNFALSQTNVHSRLKEQFLFE